MNRKKIENWVIFGLKLLPFLMLAIFAIYCHRHTIDNTTVPDTNTKVVSNLNFLSEDTTFNDFFIQETFIPEYNIYNTVYSLNGFGTSFLDIVNSPDGSYALFNIFLNSENAAGSFNVKFVFNTGDFIDIEFFTQDYEFYSVFEFNDWNTSIDNFDISSDENVYSAFNTFILGNFSYSSFYFDLGSNDFDLVEITYYNLDNPNFFVSADYTYNNFDNINPINASFIYFNEYLDYVMNFEIFNISGFYDWTVTNWFNNNPPLIYKPVFIILIYELLVDLLVLMYSFITFVIKFAQKWLNGIYNKDW